MENSLPVMLKDFFLFTNGSFIGLQSGPSSLSKKNNFETIAADRRPLKDPL